MFKIFKKDKKIINTQAELESLCEKLKKAKKIAIDTEFLREKTYYLQPCLMQISFRNEDFEKNVYTEKEREEFEKNTHCRAIDLLSNNLMYDSLKEVLEDEKILKIFHAGDQDIELIYELFGVIPKNITDTQIMSNFAYLKHNIGYSNLVKALIGEKLDKEKQRSNWKQRPLSDAQVEYALTDVKYLINIHDILYKNIEELGRIKWVREEVDSILLNIERYKKSPGEAWKHFNITGRGVRYVQIVKRLSCWRETIASRLNLPIPFVMKDSVINVIALNPPKNTKQLKGINGTRDIFRLRLHKKLLNQVKESEKLEVKDYELIPDLSLTDGQASIRDFLEMILKVKSREEKMFYEFVFSKDTFVKIANGYKPIKILEGWRYEVFGEFLNDLLNKSVRIEVEESRGINLRIEDRVRKGEIVNE